MFESPQFLKYGNLFWPDYWRNGFFLGVSDQAYSVLGLNKTVVQVSAGLQRLGNVTRPEA